MKSNSCKASVKYMLQMRARSDRAHFAAYKADTALLRGFGGCKKEKCRAFSLLLLSNKSRKQERRDKKANDKHFSAPS